MKKGFNIILAISLILVSVPILAGEKEIMNCAESFYRNGEYFNSVTEIMRCRFLYPDGKLVPAGMLLAGKAYYRGDNYSQAVRYLDECARMYGKTPEGEEAFFLGGVARLEKGSALFALSGFTKYLDEYGDGRFVQNALIYRCYSAALVDDFDRSLQWIRDYRISYPKGEFIAQADTLETQIMDEINRPVKSPIVALTGSMLLPGFGYFYAGNYRTGFLSLVSNALFISLIVTGAMTGNTFQWLFFTFVELNFYQYSIYGGLREVYLYNSRDDFRKRIKMQLSTEF